MISPERLTAQLAHLNKISAPDMGPGIHRLAFTDSDWQARGYLMQLMEDAGLTVQEDAFGNVIGHRTGADDSLPAVMLGSHADSVPSGGNYDGIVGILAAIETIRSLQQDCFKNEHPLEVVLFMCEESSRFGAATLGSRAMRGTLTPDELHRFTDKDGHSLYEILQSRSLRPEDIASAKYAKPLKAFFEVHIEQGRVLEHSRIPLGIVTGIAAPTRLRVHLHGSADHSGATPMALRHDGSCAAAEIILAVEHAATLHSDPPVVGTVGILRVHPCAMNVIPGETELGIDIRSISSAAKAETVRIVYASIRAICQKRSIPYDIEEISNETPVIMKPAVTDFLAGLCHTQGKNFIKLPSGAGHDAMHWADYAPTGMLFIPCRDGISHNPAESAERNDIVSVTEILEQAVRTATKQSFEF
jgi:beta-ureidopropionase / N-carbamoyl-L-amino-acid hydrolase